MKKGLILSLVVVLLSSTLCFAQPAPARTDKEFTAAFDAYIQSSLNQLTDIPGIAVVVIKGDKPIFVKAYGVADREAGRKADTDTLWYIASSTKSFTALAAAMLDRDGKIKLADPMTKYATGITFKNPIPDKVTVRDLLTHTTGLRNDPLGFRVAYSGDSDPKDMAQVFAGATTYDDAAYGKYRYQNLGYNIYAVLLQNYLHLKWQDVLQKQVFDPIGMKHTTAYPSRASAKKWALSQGYVLDDKTGKVIRAPLAKTDSNVQSAGGIFASISDIGRWLIVNMNDGKLNGKQVIPADVMRAVHAGYTQTTRNQPPFAGDGQYGLGWQIGKYKDDKVIYHPGGFPGYISNISYLPEKKIGVAVLVNNDMLGSRLGAILTTYAFDWLNGQADLAAIYDKQLADTVSQYPRIIQQVRGGFDDRAKRTSQLTLPLDAYAGRYSNEFWGTIEIAPSGSSLNVKMGNISYLATPFTDKDTIRVELIPGQGEVIGFQKNDEGKLVSLKYGGSIFTRQ